MSFRFTLVLLVLAVLVVGGVAVAQKKAPETAPALTPTPVIFNLQVGDVTDLDIKTSGHETELANANSKWSLLKPDQDPNVDQAKISQLVSQVAVLSGSRSVGPATDLKPFGLDQPQLTAVLTLKNGQKSTLLVGNRNVDGNYYYAMPQGGTEVSLIDSGVVNSLIGMANTPPKATPTPLPTPASASGSAAPSAAGTPNP